MTICESSVRATPFLSVVVPARSPKAFLTDLFLAWENFDALLAQKGIFVEIFFIHNGDEEPWDITLPRFQNIRFIYYYKSGFWGPSKCRNLGLSQANGKYVFFHDVDDLIIPETLCEFLSQLHRADEAKSADLFIFGYLKCTKENDVFITHEISFVNATLSSSNLIEYTKKYLDEPHRYTLLVHVWSKIYKLEFLKTNKLSFNEKLDQLEDVNFNFKALLRKPEIRLIEAPFYRYSVNSSSSNLSSLTGSTGKISISGIFKAYAPVKIFLLRVAFLRVEDTRNRMRHLYSTTIVLWLIRAIKNTKPCQYKSYATIIETYASDFRVRRAMRCYKRMPGTSRFLPKILRLRLTCLASLLVHFFPQLRKGF